MAKSLKDKVAAALKEAVGADARIQLDDALPTRLGGWSSRAPSRASRPASGKTESGSRSMRT
jgi:uncharacterized membrane protein